MEAISHQPEQIEVPVAAFADKPGLSTIYRGASSNLGVLDGDKLQRYVVFYMTLSGISAIIVRDGVPIFHRQDLIKLQNFAEEALG